VISIPLKPSNPTSPTMSVFVLVIFAHPPFYSIRILTWPEKFVKLYFFFGFGYRYASRFSTCLFPQALYSCFSTRFSIQITSVIKPMKPNADFSPCVIVHLRNYFTRFSFDLASLECCVILRERKEINGGKNERES